MVALPGPQAAVDKRNTAAQQERIGSTTTTTAHVAFSNESGHYCHGVRARTVLPNRWLACSHFEDGPFLAVMFNASCVGNLHYNATHSVGRISGPPRPPINMK